MIIEVLTHLLTPAPTYVKKMGYLKETIAIEARAKRCRLAWQPHLDKCKSLIINYAENLPQKSNIMILGSGGFHDVPIKKLLSLKHKITCTDIIHLPKIKNQFPNVNFLQRDITGLNKNIFEAVNNNTLIKPQEEWTLNQKPDLIISLNLLSQLPLKMEEYAKTQDYELESNFKNIVMENHIDWLKKQKTDVLLISDIARNYIEGGVMLEKIFSLPNLELNEPNETWVWNIAPKGEADRDINVTHDVGAWKF